MRPSFNSQIYKRLLSSQNDRNRSPSHESREGRKGVNVRRIVTRGKDSGKLHPTEVSVGRGLSSGRERTVITAKRGKKGATSTTLASTMSSNRKNPIRFNDGKERGLKKGRAGSSKIAQIAMKEVREKNGDIRKIIKGLNESNSQKHNKHIDIDNQINTLKHISEELREEIQTISNEIASQSSHTNQHLHNHISSIDTLYNSTDQKKISSIVEEIKKTRHNIESADADIKREETLLFSLQKAHKEKEDALSLVENGISKIEMIPLESLHLEIQSQSEKHESIFEDLSSLLETRKLLKERVDKARRECMEKEISEGQMEKRLVGSKEVISDLEVEIRRKKKLVEELEYQCEESREKESIAVKKSDSIDEENHTMRSEMQEVSGELNKANSDIGKYGCLINKLWKQIEEENQAKRENEPKVKKLKQHANTMTSLQIKVMTSLFSS